MFRFSSKLTPAILIKRYKRFLADVILENGETMTVHCPNTGAMTGCAEPKSKVYLSHTNNPQRKYAYTWEYASDKFGNKICINTNNANKVVKDALERGLIKELSQYSKLKTEQKTGDSRIDFLLEQADLPQCYLEVKSATLAMQDIAMFPDTITTRGQKHCRELAKLAQTGHSAKLLFCVMRESINKFKIAEQIDPDYAREVALAVNNGVEILCYGCELNADGIQISCSIPIIF